MECNVVIEALRSARVRINLSLGSLEPLRLLTVTMVTTAGACWLYDFVYREESLKQRLIKAFFKTLGRIPFVQRKIDKEINKTITDLESSMNKNEFGVLVYRVTLPENGLGYNGVLTETELYTRLNTSRWKEGYASGTVYVHNDDLNRLMTQIYKAFMWTNPLHPETFPDIRKMEAEVVRMCCAMFNGDENTCGTSSSGGTESIMLAMKAYRDLAIERGIRIPEIIIPVTAHAAFDKAAHFFKMKINHARLDPVTYKVDVRHMKSLINSSTCVLVASAPEFCHGMVDPVEEISKLGERYNIPVHVDCCLGGFLLPFLDKAGFPLNEKFDFRLPGVTSISCDTHKYGFAPKGSSVILYRSQNYRKHQIFVQPDWPGGVYASPTFAGSRPGVIIATCWASMMYHGLDGYVKCTKEIVATTYKIRDAVKNIYGLYVLGDPRVCVVSITSDNINIYNLLDALHERGWHLNPLQFPHCIHIAVTHIHTKPGVADRLISDITEATERLLKLPMKPDEGSAAIYGMAQTFPDRNLVSQIAVAFISACYNTKNAPR